jgi:hypothetical protein
MEQIKESAIMAPRAKRVTTWPIGPDGKPKRSRNLEINACQQQSQDHMQHLEMSVCLPGNVE